MAVRIYEFKVTADSITINDIKFGGVQGEHNATQLNFTIDSELWAKLAELLGNNQKICYRFDCIDGGGGKYSTELVEFNPKIEKENFFTHIITNHQTRNGGLIQVYFVITIIDNKGTEDAPDYTTEMELYSYCVKLKLKAKPTGEEVDGGDYESISTLAIATKKNAELAKKAADSAAEAVERTEAARLALEGDTEWLFDGGTPSGSVEIDLVIDGEMSYYSNNPVQNKVIKAYIDEQINAVNQTATNAKNTADEADKAVAELEETVNTNSDNQSEKNERFTKDINDLFSRDYIFEEATVGIWTYRKWNNGIAECWGTTSTTFDFTEDWVAPSIYLASKKVSESYPEGLFLENAVPNCQYSIESGNQCSIFPISSGALGTHEKTPSVRAARCNTADTNITVKIHWRVTGKWK